MIVKTRKLPATSSDSERMRATSDKGHTLTVPFPYASTDPDEHVAVALMRAMFPVGPYAVTRTGAHVWRVEAYMTSEEK